MCRRTEKYDKIKVSIGFIVRHKLRVYLLLSTAPRNCSGKSVDVKNRSCNELSTTPNQDRGLVASLMAVILQVRHQALCADGLQSRALIEVLPGIGQTAYQRITALIGRRFQQGYGLVKS